MIIQHIAGSTQMSEFIYKGKESIWKTLFSAFQLLNAFNTLLFCQLNVIRGDLKGFIWIRIPEAISCETVLTLIKPTGAGKFNLSEKCAKILKWDLNGRRSGRDYILYVYNSAVFWSRKKHSLWLEQVSLKQNIFG
uniref:Uncharacterized protein n=1 Tax=Glossina palpalis gambiensis TaxID=67801 RepID=A0A1B0BVT7_9MUSC